MDLSQLFLPDSAALATQERHRLRDGRLQGFKTPTKLKIWWLSNSLGLNTHLNET